MSYFTKKRAVGYLKHNRICGQDSEDLTNPVVWQTVEGTGEVNAGAV